MFKDYNGEQVTASNLYAVILGDKKSLKGGSGKVVDSKPGDRIFIYYSDHGGPGVLGELIASIFKAFLYFYIVINFKDIGLVSCPFGLLLKGVRKIHPE